MQQDEDRLALPHLPVVNRQIVDLCKPALRIGKVAFGNGARKRRDWIQQWSDQEYQDRHESDDTDDFPGAPQVIPPPTPAESPQSCLPPAVIDQMRKWPQSHPPSAVIPLAATWMSFHMDLLDSDGVPTIYLSPDQLIL
jgi:hypothetical protein